MLPQTEHLLFQNPGGNNRLCSEKQHKVFILVAMYLMYYLSEHGDRIYTMKVRFSSLRSSCIACNTGRINHCFSCSYNHYHDLFHGRIYASTPYPLFAPNPSTHYRSSSLQKHAPDGTPTQSAHPARFSPDDKFSRERITTKKRFGLLPTQQPPVEY